MAKEQRRELMVKVFINNGEYRTGFLSSKR